jgi:hypothetical protein
MGRDQDRNESFEWVNAWAAAASPESTPHVAVAAPVAPPPAPPAPAIADKPVTPHPARQLLQPSSARFVVARGDDQLMRDIAEIERVRDALAALPVAARKRTQAFTLVPTRTTDPVPVVVGGVLALVMLTVFGAAAAMTKLAR